MTDTPKNFGRGDMMAVAAFRYCLGRSTYIVGDCVDWLNQQWPNIAPNARAVILRDLREEFQRDDEFREVGHEFKPLGMDMDRAQWQRALEMMERAP